MERAISKTLDIDDERAVRVSVILVMFNVVQFLQLFVTARSFQKKFDADGRTKLIVAVENFVG